MLSIRRVMSKRRIGVLLGGGASVLLVIAGMEAKGAVLRARVLAPPGACVLEDSSFQTADGGCKDLATWLVYSFADGNANIPPGGSYSDAVAYCNTLVEGGDVGYDDWVLPSKGEMQSAAGRDIAHHFHFPPYPLLNRYIVWSSDTKGSNSAYAVDYDDGYTQTVLKTSNLDCNCRRYAGPSGLSATVISKSEIDLAWIDNSESETGFVLERSLDQTSWTPIYFAANTQSDADTGLSANTTYYYRVRAQGTVTDSPTSAVVSAKTKRN